MQLKHYKAGSIGQTEVDTSVFGEKVLHRTLKDAVVMYQANQRLGTVNTRGRDQVKGSNKKPWAQKHTGRARAGDRKSPIWRGGGIVFGPKPRDYSYHMPVKMRRVALRTALAGKLADGEVVVAELGRFDKPSAKEARKILAAIGSPRRALVLIAEHNENAHKSFRNFPGVSMRTAKDVCALDVIAGGIVLAERAALEQIAARVGSAKTKKAAAAAAKS